MRGLDDSSKLYFIIVNIPEEEVSVLGVKFDFLPFDRIAGLEHGIITWLYIFMLSLWTQFRYIYTLKQLAKQM